MDSTKLTLNILSAGNTPIPGVVATELLSMVPSDMVPNSLLNFGTFEGPNAAKVAKSCQKKAKLIAANTVDQDVHRAVFEALLVQVPGMNAGLQARNITDTELLIDIHQLVWEDRISASDYENARTWIIDVVPLEYQLEYLVESPVQSRYELSKVGSRIGSALLAGDFGCLRHVDAIAERYLTPTTDTRTKDLLRAIGYKLAFSADIDVMLAATEAIEDHLEPKWADEVVTSMCERAKVLDERLLIKVLKYLPTPAEFRDAQMRSIASHYTGSVMQAPRELLGRDLRFTMPALHLLAENFPAALVETLSHLAMNDPNRHEIIDLALESNLVVLAHELLRPAKFAGSTTHATMSPDQFHRAIGVYQTGRLIQRKNTEKPEIRMSASAHAIPQGADPDDVIELLSMVKDPEVLFDRWFSTHGSDPLSYQPNDEEIERLLSALDPTTRLNVLNTTLHHWAYLTGGKVDPDIEPALAARIHLVAQSVSACDLASLRNGPRYLAHVLSYEFGDNIEQWRIALGLLPTATVPLSAVITAAKRLG